jgi:hypothetical protein
MGITLHLNNLHFTKKLEWVKLNALRYGYSSKTLSCPLI